MGKIRANVNKIRDGAIKTTYRAAILNRLLLLLLLQATYLRAAKVNHIVESEARFSRSEQKASWKW